MKGYLFSRHAIDPMPRAKLRRPLNEARIALVTTAGLKTPAQAGFDHSIKLGDTLFREIPNTIETRTLIESHRSYAFDHAGIQADNNLAFPFDLFREVETQGVIGQLNHRHVSFMGSNIDPHRLTDETGPKDTKSLREEGADAVF